MANNIISRELLEQCKRLNDGQSCEICNNFAKKLDRLVEAAKDALIDLCHFHWCNLYNGDNCSCGIGPVKDELTASLREIELPSEVEHGE